MVFQIPSLKRYYAEMNFGIQGLTLIMQLCTNTAFHARLAQRTSVLVGSICTS